MIFINSAQIQTTADSAVLRPTLQFDREVVTEAPLLVMTHGGLRMLASLLNRTIAQLDAPATAPLQRPVLVKGEFGEKAAEAKKEQN